MGVVLLMCVSSASFGVFDICVCLSVGVCDVCVLG